MTRPMTGKLWAPLEMSACSGLLQGPMLQESKSHEIHHGAPVLSLSARGVRVTNASVSSRT